MPRWTYDEDASLPEAVRSALKDDPSHLAAVEYVLRHNVSLVQGPPGTGKSFVGVQIAKAPPVPLRGSTGKAPGSKVMLLGKSARTS